MEGKNRSIFIYIENKNNTNSCLKTTSRVYVKTKTIPTFLGAFGGQKSVLCSEDGTAIMLMYSMSGLD